MAATTSRGIQYPTSGDNITPLETHFANLAESTDTAITDGLNAQSIPAGGLTGQILAKDTDTDFDTTWIDNYTSQIKHTVKAGEALTKGMPVYVSSANGTNMIVSISSNATEARSSKTMGLIAQDLLLNGQGFVIGEGLLAGLNTDAASAAGAPVWLGVDGALIYGTPPTAPAHMVYLGVVTRKHATQGEIFVKVQNGYELGELHNVSIPTPADNNLLTYDNATSLWTNQTADQANVVDKTTAQTIAGNKTFTGVTDVAGGLSQDGNQILNGSDTWLRTTGQTGWYSTTYGGGWYMTDGTWIRAYNGKNVYSPGTIQAGTIYSEGRNYSPHTPYAVATGSSVINFSASTTSATLTVTFPVGRFTVAPIIVVSSAGSPRFVGAAASSSTTGFQLTGYRASDEAITGATTMHWHAIQMTSSTAAG